MSKLQSCKQVSFCPASLERLEVYIMKVQERWNCLVGYCVHIGHTHLTHSYILNNDASPQCEHCQYILTVCHILAMMLLKQWKIILGRIDVREREMFYLTTHSTHFIYGYMASDIRLRTILIVRKETRCRRICYSYRLTARVLLYAPSHRQDNTYHDLCYTSRGALAETRNRSMGPPHEGLIRRPIAPWANALPLSYVPLPRVDVMQSFRIDVMQSFRIDVMQSFRFYCTFILLFLKWCHNYSKF